MAKILDMADEQQMVLRTEDLVKKYKTRTVVNHVSINVKQGEIVGLLGPNGAGKTTTFYMTVGLVTPNEGKIFLNDMEITKFPVYKRARNGIGYLAQLRFFPQIDDHRLRRSDCQYYPGPDLHFRFRPGH